LAACEIQHQVMAGYTAFNDAEDLMTSEFEIRRKKM
jgi:hypothetical protein